jgi:hypothetical protein
MAMTEQKTGLDRRAERLRAALRENLKRRKVQAKGKSAGRQDNNPGQPVRDSQNSPNSAGFAPDKPKG